MYPTDSHTESAGRERSLLLIAAAFLIVGALTLVVRQSPSYVEAILKNAGASFSLPMARPNQLEGAILMARPNQSEGAIRMAPYWPLVICSFIASFAVAHVLLNRHLPQRDPFLLPTAALLTGWGLLLIGRLAVNFLLRQMAWLPIAVAAFLAPALLGRGLRWLRRFRYTWLFGGLALLAATLIFGVNPSGYGPRLWLGGWGTYFQPSELLKLLMVAFLASYLAEKGKLLVSEGQKVGPWHLPPLAYVGPLLVMFGLTGILLAWQQDLGAAMLFFFTFLAMLYLATGQWQYAAAGLTLFAIVGLVGYQLSDRVALRIEGWLNPWPEAADRAFQIVQSVLAFGAGGVFGRGLGLGNPTYIPAVHTDFVFAAIGEEFGLTGTLVVISLYGVLMLRGFRIAARAPRPFERFLAAGLTAGLVIQAWVIMAGNAKLAPIAGVTLPFVSYGGSSLLTSFIALGLLVRISSPNSDARSPTSERQGTKPPTTTPSVERAHSPDAHAPLLHLTGALTLGLALLAIMCGYWAIVRADDLRARDDNPRHVLYEQRIVRGRILDREGKVLAGAEMTDDGTVTRRYPVPEAAPAVGYASLRYGTGGIESAFDTELRGETGRPAWLAAWEELLHRPPHGHHVQLTLDADLQTQAQEALAGRTGAAVLLDVTTGEILALASSPTFDPEHLDEEWEALSEDPDAPLLNRATQGLYQPGAAIQTAIVAEAVGDGLTKLTSPVDNAAKTLSVNGTPLGCNGNIAEPLTLGEAYAAACPAPVADWGPRLGTGALEAAIERWALTTPPPLEITTEASDWNTEALSNTAALRAEAIGQGRLTVSPLQMALVAAALGNEGHMPAPRLALRAQDTNGEWKELPAEGEARTILSSGHARDLLAVWQRPGDDIAAHWGLAVAGKGQPPHTWFLGVAPTGSPRYAVAVLLEHPADRHRAAEIGKTLLDATVSARPEPHP